MPDRSGNQSSGNVGDSRLYHDERDRGTAIDQHSESPEQPHPAKIPPAASDHHPLIHPSLPPPLSTDLPLSKLAHLDPNRLYRAFTSFAESFPPLKKAMSTLESALRLYTPNNLAVAFNGGKDATVVMHIARAAVANWSRMNNKPARLHCLYLLGAPGEQFSQVDSFVRRQVAECNLDGVEVELGIKEGICEFVKRSHGMCAFVMGTRRADPYSSSMEHFEPSSIGWPPFMRVNPIVTWEYHHIWEFLRHFELPYCCLYDEGYTSIGSVATTRPNPALAEIRGGGAAYRPAWMLADESMERAGRLPKPSSS